MTAARPPAADVVRLVVTGAAADGRGHVARALALGEALRSRDVAVEIAAIRGALSGREHERATALGITLAPDPRTGTAAVVVVDLPDPDEPVHRPPGSRLAVFDDRERFRGDADLVIQPSLPAWSGTARADRVMAGYAVIPLAGRIRDLAARVAPVAGDAELATRPAAVLACFGGSDPARVTARLAGAIAAGPWATTLVVGASYDGPTAGWPVEPVRDPADLVERLARCDIAVLGAGTMKFEAACLGRPTILLAAADDQLPVGEAFARTGAAVWLGDGRTIEPDLVRTAIAGLVGDGRRRAALATAARALVDGNGAFRLADAILGLIRR